MLIKVTHFTFYCTVLYDCISSICSVKEDDDERFCLSVSKSLRAFLYTFFSRSRQLFLCAFAKVIRQFYESALADHKNAFLFITKSHEKVHKTHGKRRYLRFEQIQDGGHRHVGKISCGDISATGRPIHFMFGYRVGFSGTADLMALFSIRTNSRWRRPPSWLISNVHISATVHDLLI